MTPKFRCCAPAALRASSGKRLICETGKMAHKRKDQAVKRKQHRNDRRKRQKDKYRVYWLGGMAFLCIMAILMVSMYQMLQYHAGKRAADEEDREAAEEQITELPIAVTETPTTTPEAEKEIGELTDHIYTYLQGPKSWKRGLDWSGEWGDSYMDGGYFGGFGCGLCCMANIYSTLTDFQCSPLDMYQYAKKHTGYCGGMAIGWGYMRRSLTSLGFDCRVAEKPAAYREFAADMERSLSSIVLVSSADSTVYWQNTPGHYVTIFLYDPERQRVFLADSGDPEHNRHWVSLKKIYRSLKTASSWQYLVVEGYDAKKDSWRHKKTSGRWSRPSYL